MQKQPDNKIYRTPYSHICLRFRLLGSILVLVLWFAALSLSAAPADDLYQKMISSYGKLSSWQATVSQTNVFKQSNSTLKSSGTFYYQKGKLAIKYNKPNEQQLVVQNGKLSVYDKANNTVYKSTLQSAISSLNPVEIVKSYWTKSKHLIMKSEPGFSQLKLIPASDPSVKEIILKVDTKTGYIHHFQYIDKQGNSLSISFTKIKVNPTLPASVFKLTYPKSAKVFEQ